MTRSQLLYRKALAGMILEKEISKYCKGTIHVAMGTTDCTITVLYQGQLLFGLVFVGLSQATENPAFNSSDLEDVAKQFTSEYFLKVSNSFFKIS